MTPEGLAAARRRIGVVLTERQEKFARSARDLRAEATMRGSASGTGFVQVIHKHAAEELDLRAQLVWEVIKSVRENEGWSSSEDAAGQVNVLLEEVVIEGSGDIDEIFSKAYPRWNENRPTLDEPRRRAINKAAADAEIDALGRRARFVPLLEVISAPRYAASLFHWKSALDHAEQIPPDIPNAIKEAVSAVEALAQIVLGESGHTLGSAVKELRSRKTLPAGSDKILDGLWAFANATPGARHGGIAPPGAEDADWAFVRLVSEGGTRLLLSLDTA